MRATMAKVLLTSGLQEHHALSPLPDGFRRDAPVESRQSGAVLPRQGEKIKIRRAVGREKFGPGEVGIVQQRDVIRAKLMARISTKCSQDHSDRFAAAQAIGIPRLAGNANHPVLDQW